MPLRSLHVQRLFVPPAAIPHLIQLTPARLALAERLAARRGVRTIPRRPRRSSFTARQNSVSSSSPGLTSGLTCAIRLARIDTGVDEVNRAADLLGFAVVQRPERAVGTAILRGQAAVQVDDSAAAPCFSSGPDQRRTEHAIRSGCRRSASSTTSRIIDVRHFDDEFRPIQPSAARSPKKNFASRSPV